MLGDDRMTDEVRDLVERLELEPHPEGGFYRETFRHQQKDGGRGHATAIYYLLQGAGIPLGIGCSMRTKCGAFMGGVLLTLRWGRLRRA